MSFSPSLYQGSTVVPLGMNLIILISFVCTGAAGVAPATHYAGDPNAAAVAAMYSRGAAPGDVMFKQ